MTQYIKQKQVVAIYPSHYEIVFTDTDPEKVKKFAKTNRIRLKKAGAVKVVTNSGFYKV